MCELSCAHRNDQTLRGPLLYAQKFKSIHQAGDTSLVEKSSAQYDSVKNEKILNDSDSLLLLS